MCKQMVWNYSLFPMLASFYTFIIVFLSGISKYKIEKRIHIFIGQDERSTRNRRAFSPPRFSLTKGFLLSQKCSIYNHQNMNISYHPSFIYS